MNIDRSAMAESLIAAVGTAFGGRDAVHHAVRADGRIVVSGPSGGTLLAVNVRRPSRPALLEAWSALRADAPAGAIPVLLVPHLSRSLRDLASEAQMNWVDAAGNAAIAAPSLVVQIQGRDLAHPLRRRGVDPFAPRSASIARLLLVEPHRRWRQKELVEHAEISQSQASKVLGALREMALIHVEDDGRLDVPDPEGLLDAWADSHRYRRQEIVPAHLSGEGAGLARELHERLRAIQCEHWFTGLPAAWAYDHFARFRLVSVFVDDEPESIRRRLELRHAPRGANIHLIATNAQRIDIGASRPDGLPCAHPAQVYVDLLGLPERASEAADHLRPLAIAGRP